LDNDGIHKMVGIYDRKKRLVGLTFFNTLGLPTLHKHGYHKSILQLDRQGDLIRTGYFDVDGQRVTLKGNHNIIVSGVFKIVALLKDVFQFVRSIINTSRFFGTNSNEVQPMTHDIAHKTLPVRIVVLSDRPVAFPSIETLLKTTMLVGLGVPDIVGDHYFRIKTMAEEKGIPFAAIIAEDIETILNNWFAKCFPEVVIVIGFPYKIPSSILSIPRFGFLNFHLGLLPAYRSADPIFWEIRNQEKRGGVTVHIMDEKFNNGPIVYTEEVPLEHDLYGQHIQKLAMAANKCMQWLIELLQKSPSELPSQPQDATHCQHYSRPNFFNLMISWTEQTAHEIAALVRASNPTYGGAITFFRGVPIHLLEVELLQNSLDSIQSLVDINTINVIPGTIVLVNNNGIVLTCKDRELLRLQVTYTEDGFFTAGKLAQTFSIKPGEIFAIPSMK